MMLAYWDTERAATVRLSATELEAVFMEEEPTVERLWTLLLGLWAQGPPDGTPATQK
jgi:hypothetical protein